MESFLTKLNKMNETSITDKPKIAYSECYAQVFLGDCLELYKNIEPKSIDLILTDLPYGTTACKWDTIIPFDKLWEMVNYLLKPNGAFITTASQPFTSALVMSKIDWFKYSLVWEKERPSNPAHAKIRFMKWHEDILVFAPNKEKFIPQKELRLEKNKRNNKQGVIHTSDVYGSQIIPQGDGLSDEKYLSSVLKVNVERGLHPTQKPVTLFEILVKSFTDEGDTVLDNCMGSGTTGVACKNTNRSFIGIEKDEGYFKIAEQRINARTY